MFDRILNRSEFVLEDVLDGVQVRTHGTDEAHDNLGPPIELQLLHGYLLKSDTTAE
jgi:hypothetical protein